MAVTNETVIKAADSHASVISFTIAAGVLALLIGGYFISSQFQKPDQKITVTYNPEDMEVVSKGDYERVYKMLGEFQERSEKAEEKAQALQDKIDGKKPAPAPSAATIKSYGTCDDYHFYADGHNTITTPCGNIIVR